MNAGRRRVRVLILRAAGTNCDRETEFAWRTAGAEPELLHIRRLIESPRLLDDFQIMTIPGGFSYGDDIAAGRIFAAQLARTLIDPIREFVARGGLVLGICNGFQILVKAGLLLHERASCTITHNDPPGFQDRWTTLTATTERCPFLTPGQTYEMPIAHGEGRVVFANEAALAAARAAGRIALTYRPGGSTTAAPPGAPYNPNGSTADIAGLCDETGRILGLMPHPDRFVAWTQHPRWTSLPPRTEGDGLALFRSAVRVFE